MTNTIRVDLHCHSFLSDGSLSPEHVAEELLAARVGCAALTDHNTTGGQARFRAALARRGARFISGVEMDVRSPEGPLHLLAYGFDLKEQALRQTLQALDKPVWAATRYWLERVCRLKSAWPPEALTALLARGLLDIGDAIRLIHRAGGRAFLAHPLTPLGSLERLEALLTWAQPQGLDGIEAFYKPYSEETRQALLEIAGRHRLLASAGSDFHGPYFPGGANPGLDMPKPHWRRFAQATGIA